MEIVATRAAAMAVTMILEKTWSSGGQILGAVVFRSSGGQILALGVVLPMVAGRHFGAVRPELLD